MLCGQEDISKIYHYSTPVVGMRVVVVVHWYHQAPLPLLTHLWYTEKSEDKHCCEINEWSSDCMATVTKHPEKGLEQPHKACDDSYRLI